jgi:hypothetical protein
MLAKIKDITATTASIITALSFIFGAYQFYLARIAIESQTIRGAVQQSVQIHENIFENADIFSKIVGKSEEDIKKNMLIRQVISLYVNVYYDYDASLLPDGAWPPILREICGFVSLPSVDPIISSAISGRQYPDDFINILKTCKN